MKILARHINLSFYVILVLLLCWLDLPRIGAETRKYKVVKNDSVDLPNHNTTTAENVATKEVAARKWQWLWWTEQPPEDKQLVQVLSSTELEVANQNRDHKKGKRRKRRPKTGKQKMANCRHLASMPGSGSWSHRVKNWWRQLSRRPHHPTSSPSSSSADMNIAYGMAVAATLSYWEFHKKPLPDNRTYYEVLSLKEGQPQPLSRYRKRARSVLSNLRLALDEAQPWLLWVKNRTKKAAPPENNKNSLSTSSSSSSSSRWTTFKDRLEEESKIYRDNFRQLRDRYATRKKHQIQLEYSFYNWYEPTPLGNYHDTDLLIATSNNGNTLIIAFAGTASVTDSVTNLQTFEPASHSGFFQNQTTTGSIHRGFLNAYSRVERGSVLRLCDEANCTTPLLYQRYGHCTPTTSTPPAAGNSTETQDASSNNNNNDSSEETAEESIVRKKGRRGCKIKNKKLMTILRELVTEYLSNGKSVLLSGHSLGGSLVTLHALDIIINFPLIPISNLELWTFGGAQVADDAFLQSALAVAPRLKHFLREENPKMGTPTGTTTIRSRFHRFVTVSDDCKVDFISEVAQKTLTPDNERNIHGKTARKLGGIRGNSVVHLTDPHYLLTPDQYDFSSIEEENNNHDASTGSPASNMQEDQDANGPSQAPTNDKVSSTRSTLAAHSTVNYLKGITRESKDHPLSTDLPDEVRDWLGELPWNTATA